MEKKKKQGYKLSPKEYRDNLAHIELRNIVMINGSAKLKKENLEINQAMNFIIVEKANFSKKYSTENMIVIIQKYTLTTYHKEKTDYIFKIIGDYEITLDQQKKLSKDFWDIYKNMNLPVNTYPYFREFAQSMTQRLNLPPLTLPLSKWQKKGEQKALLFFWPIAWLS